MVPSKEMQMISDFHHKTSPPPALKMDRLARLDGQLHAALEDATQAFQPCQAPGGPRSCWGQFTSFQQNMESWLPTVPSQCGYRNAICTIPQSSPCLWVI